MKTVLGRAAHATPLMRRAGGLAVVATLLAAAACGETAARSGGDADSASPLPGIKEFGLNEEQFAAHIERTQELIASCMTKAGFEYVPVDVQTIEDAQARVRMDPGYTRRSFKEKWGLAVTTRFDNPVRDTGLGPNLKIWKSLPPADQDAWAHTLWGEDPDDPEADFVFAFDEEDLSNTGGCTRRAVARVFTPSQLKGTYENPKDVLVEEDPRIVEANQKWTECMHAAGYEYEDDQDAIIEDYQDRLDELLDGDDPMTLTGARRAALEKLQREEIEVSLVDLECQLKHVDHVYHEVELEVFGQPVSG